MSDAVVAGELDDAFPNVDFLEFDLDRHASALSEAGYASRLVPLFALPEPGGRASDTRIAGGIKGAGAVDNLRHRLGAMLKEAS